MRPGSTRHRPRALVLMGLAGVVAAAAACGGDGEPEGYGPELRAEFVEDCVATGTADDVCRCFYDSLEAEVPFDRYQRIEERVREGADIPPDVADLAAACDAAQPPTTPAPPG